MARNNMGKLTRICLAFTAAGMIGGALINKPVDWFSAPFKRTESNSQGYTVPFEEVISSEEAVEKDISYKTTDFSNDNEIVLLARMIFGEARNCSDTERIAIAYTAVNRANDGKSWNGETIRDSLLTPWQYSCFNEGDVNREKLMDPQSYNSNVFYECLAVAGKVLSGEVRDPTNGATHYFNPDVVRPSWTDKITKIGKIQTEKGLSRHEFYRED